MFEHERPIFALNLGLCRRLVEDISDSEFSLQPSPGMNPPVWILGHLAISLDGAGRMLGLEPECPPRWHELFGRGSTPPGPDVELPSKDDLLAALEKGHARISESAPKASPERLSQPHPLEMLRQSPLKTTGDLLAFLMTGHFSFHLGQLSAWRRVTGRPPLF